MTLLDELPAAALTAVRQVAEELTVRESMIFLDGREFHRRVPGAAYRPARHVNARLSDRRPRRTRGHHPGELDRLTQATIEDLDAIRQVLEQLENRCPGDHQILIGDSNRTGVYYDEKGGR